MILRRRGFHIVNGRKIEGINERKIMKKGFLLFAVIVSLSACNGNDEADKRQYNNESGTTTAPGDGSNTTVDDSTATTNNNAYNTDSASGQGNRFDSSNSRNK